MKFLFLLSWLISFSALACNQTYQGEEFDQLIKIRKIEVSTVEITVPRKVKHLDFGVRIMIHYYKEGDSLKISHEQQQLSPQLQGDSYIAVGHLLTSPGLTAYVTVLWKPEACCECPAIGQSNDI